MAQATHIRGCCSRPQLILCFITGLSGLLQNASHLSSRIVPRPDYFLVDDCARRIQFNHREDFPFRLSRRGVAQIPQLHAETGLRFLDGGFWELRDSQKCLGGRRAARRVQLGRWFRFVKRHAGIGI